MGTGERVKIYSWPSFLNSGSNVDHDTVPAGHTKVKKHGMCPNCCRFGRLTHERLTLKVLLTCKMPWLLCYVE